MKKSYIVIILVILIIFSSFNVLSGIFTGGGQDKVEIHDQSFSRIEIDTHNAEIHLFVTDDKPYVELINKNREELNVNFKGDTLDIEVKQPWAWSNWFSFDFSFKSPKLNVYLPKDVYESIKSETHNGSIHIANIEVNELKARTHNGGVFVNNVESSAIDIESHNGDMKLENVSGIVNGVTHNGNVTIEKNNINNSIYFETHNGDVTIITKEEPTNVTYQFKTHNGDIKVFGSDFFDTVIGNGENLIKLTSHNGNITVKK